MYHVDLWLLVFSQKWIKIQSHKLVISWGHVLPSFSCQLLMRRYEPDTVKWDREAREARATEMEQNTKVSLAAHFRADTPTGLQS